MKCSRLATFCQVRVSAFSQTPFPCDASLDIRHGVRASCIKTEGGAMKKWLCLAMVAAMAALGAGCAKQKLLTPEEIAAERERQLNMIARTYNGVTPQDALLAADRVFRLADEDYTVSHNPTGLQAQRNWLIYAVLAVAAGTDTWNVITEVLPSGETKVTAMHSGQGASMFGGPVATSGGGTSATGITTPGMQNMTTRPAIYQLFFARLDYLLGKSNEWITCKDAGKLFKDGSLDPFCTVANDRTPDGKSAAQRRAMDKNTKN